MAGRTNIKERIEREMSLDADDIKLLYNLTPENFEEFREKFYAQLVDTRSVIIFCA